MNLPRSPVRRILVVALLISVVVGAIHLAACWYSVAPNGSDFFYKSVSWVFPIYFLLLALYNVLYLIVDAVGLLFGRRKTTWREVGARTVFCGVLFVLMFVIVGSGESIRDAGYRGITRRGAKLVAAIKQYQTAHGALPDTLDALVPQCLPAIPDTGVGPIRTMNSSRTKTQPDTAAIAGCFQWMYLRTISRVTHYCSIPTESIRQGYRSQNSAIGR